MKVLKFGGGCLKDVKSIKTLPGVLKKYNNQQIIVVLSAFGKLTNMLENRSYQDVMDFVNQIILGLNFSNDERKAIIKNYLGLKQSILQDDYPSRVAMGEYISTDIIQRYLCFKNISSIVLDATTCIYTKSWNSKLNSANFHSAILSDSHHAILNKNSQIVITQGFIASDINYMQHTSQRKITTLGREGSDYSAAIFAGMLDAEEVILFKDVDGIYDLDPKKNSTAKLFHRLTYDEAFKICNNGNTIVHPKTINHLKVQDIPIRIKNFSALSKRGSIITH